MNSQTLKLVLLEMSSYIEQATNGKIDVKLGATIRQHLIEVEKAVKAERKAIKEATAE